jgi:hypothetical protein
MGMNGLIAPRGTRMRKYHSLKIPGRVRTFVGMNDLMLHRGVQQRDYGLEIAVTERVDLNEAYHIYPEERRTF